MLLNEDHAEHFVWLTNHQNSNWILWCNFLISGSFLDFKFCILSKDIFLNNQSGLKKLLPRVVSHGTRNIGARIKVMSHRNFQIEHHCYHKQKCVFKHIDWTKFQVSKDVYDPWTCKMNINRFLYKDLEMNHVHVEKFRGDPLF